MEGWKTSKSMKETGKFTIDGVPVLRFGELLPVQYCSNEGCKEKAPVLFKGCSHPESWFWLQCSVEDCGQPLCDTCVDVWDEDTSKCDTCEVNDYYWERGLIKKYQAHGQGD